MRDEEIIRLLENVEVTPSMHCWEAIEGNLAAAAGTAGAAATATKVAGHALSTAAKVIIGAVSTSAIATTAVILALTGVFSPKETEVAEQQTVTMETTGPEEPVAMAAEVTEVNASVTTAETQVLAKAISPSLTTNGNAVPATTEPAALSEPEPVALDSRVAIEPAPQTPSSGTPAKTSTAPSVPKPSPKPATATETAQPSAVTDLSDPVLEDADVMSNIDFSQPVALVIPNIITPNGDGANDFFIIQGIEQCERNRLIIRNSHGNIVFQTTNYQNNWGASGLSDGTYFYQFAYSIHGIEETRTGTLTIMR